MPSAVQQGLQQGSGAWNLSECNTGGDDFPRFVTSGSADRELFVTFHNSRSPEDASCASMDHNAGQLNLYATANYPPYGAFPCFPNSEVAADAVAHELGHFLGLGDVGGANCSDYIMAPGTYTIQNGQISYGTFQAIQEDECETADYVNSTPTEELAESPPPIDPGTQNPPGAVDGSGSPILLDLSRNGFALTGLAAGVRFDIDADGVAETVSWTQSGSDDAFLVLDRDGNGWIEGGAELFGDATPQPASASANGYLALAVFDGHTGGGNGDGQITEADRVFSGLRLWTDENHDGRSQAGELATLESQGVEAIDLIYRESRRRDRYGNEFRYRSVVRFAGQRAPVFCADVFFLVGD
jgi:hypothetical protein